ncbi:MAG: HrpE/YscL family type III secretion apparatus protein [Dehalococcoidia bacterium]
MADTIESFVTKLKSEGVEEGRRQAEQLRADAEKRAEQIVAEARNQAEKIIADAKAEADGIVTRGKTELELAARDATLKLRESLEKSLEKVLAGGVEEKLEDTEFLKQLIELIVKQYLYSDESGTEVITVSVPAEKRQQLTDWLFGKIRAESGDSMASLDIKDKLRQAGFEVSFHGATIEVTRDSVVEVLMQLVGPGLRDILGQVKEEN